MKKIAVFCGSGVGTRPQYKQVAEQLGEELVKRNIGLVYGGGRIGLMGAIARKVLDLSGRVTGVIPRALFKKEVAFTELSDLRVVNSMHERKSLIHEISDGFIALPGGLGTFEEILEAVTWAQLDYHRKPCGLLNTEKFYDPLIELLHHSVTEQFLQRESLGLLFVENDPAKLLDDFADYQAPVINKISWATKK